MLTAIRCASSVLRCAVPSPCRAAVLRCAVRLQFLPSVTELVVAQCYYLDFDDKNRNKPIYVYLNSTGCINEQGQAVSADNEFYAIWAALGFTRAPLYTGKQGQGL
jgi:ATP-dependent protease ClpP protease subunit